MAENYEKIAEKNRAVIKKMIADGKLPEAHPLNRSQRKELDKAGYNFLKPKDGEKRSFFKLHEDSSDYILDKYYSEFGWDSVSNNICLAFADYVIHLTYGDEIAEKN